MQKKILLYGNCQTRAIKTILESNSNFIEDYEVRAAEAWCLTPDEVDELYDYVRDIDILIMHYIHDGYKGYKPYTSRCMLENVKKTCHIVFIPNCYFRAYFPDLINLIGERKISHFPYHEKFIIRSYLDGKSKEEVFEGEFNVDPEADFKELNRRYNEINADFPNRSANIKIHDYIRYNYQKIRLFQTINHPTNALLNELTKRICSALFLPYKSYSGENELLDCRSPIFENVRKKIGLTFDDRMINYCGVDMNVEGLIDFYYRLYDDQPREKLEAAI